MARREKVDKEEDREEAGHPEDDELVGALRSRAVRAVQLRRSDGRDHVGWVAALRTIRAAFGIWRRVMVRSARGCSPAKF